MERADAGVIDWAFVGDERGEGRALPKNGLSLEPEDDDSDDVEEAAVLVVPTQVEATEVIRSTEQRVDVDVDVAAATGVVAAVAGLAVAAPPPTGMTAEAAHCLLNSKPDFS
mmetsp:Transcript_47633/g.102675  ORF Transcript_47633/g.102675 Transcript_47633/m.102675 type:complete len:112 (+) Transcript_47633:886-1221(+)